MSDPNAIDHHCPLCGGGWSLAAGFDEPVTTEWLVDAGGVHQPPSVDLEGRSWPVVKYGPLVWKTTAWTTGPDAVKVPHYAVFIGDMPVLDGRVATRGAVILLAAALGEGVVSTEGPPPC